MFDLLRIVYNGSLSRNLKITFRIILTNARLNVITCNTYAMVNNTLMQSSIVVNNPEHICIFNLHAKHATFTCKQYAILQEKLFSSRFLFKLYKKY